MTVERVYEQFVRKLSVPDRLRLIERIVHDLSTDAPGSESGERYDWMALEGIAPNLLAGEDAQDWVSRTRQEADDHREQQWEGER
jgi:hypothetical protein